MTPEYGWAPPGERAEDLVPRNRGKVTTMIGALRLAGLVAMMAIEGATDRGLFAALSTDQPPAPAVACTTARSPRATREGGPRTSHKKRVTIYLESYFKKYIDTHSEFR